MKDYVKIFDKKFETLLALTSKEQEKGLMGVEWPPPVMSFIYDRPRINKFWMYNTNSPLDIVFCHKNKIISICSGIPYSEKIIGEDKFSDLVIEFPAGTCKANAIQEGDEIELECCDNSLMKIFLLKNGLFR